MKRPRSVLTWLLVQDLLELGPLVLGGLLQEVWPQALDGEVHHVGLHQAQHTEDLPENTAGKLTFGPKMLCVKSTKVQ